MDDKIIMNLPISQNGQLHCPFREMNNWVITYIITATLFIMNLTFHFRDFFSGHDFRPGSGNFWVIVLISQKIPSFRCRNTIINI